MDQLTENKHHARKRVLWGVILIGAGCLFLLERMDILVFSGLWHFWPIFILLSGAVDIFAATKVKHVTQGLNQVLLGAWLFVVIEHLWGCTFGNSWPILLIGFGISIAADGLFGNRAANQEKLQ